MTAVSEQPYEPLSPLDIEQKLRWLSTQLTQAQKALEKARDDEVSKRHALNAARRRAILSEDCPKVTRGGVTTAERDAWVDDRLPDLQLAYDLASAKRESAQDHLRVLREQAEITRSLGTFVRQAYELAGSGATS